MNFETYLTNTIQEAVQEEVLEEFDKLKNEIVPNTKSDKRNKQIEKTNQKVKFNILEHHHT